MVKYIVILLLSLIVSAITVALIYLYGIVEKKAGCGVYRFLNRYRTKKSRMPAVFSGRKTVCLLGVCEFVFFFFMVYLCRDIHVLDWCKLILLLGVLAVAAVIDWRYHIIPNKVVLAALAGRIVLYVPEFIWRRDLMKPILLSSLAGFLFGFGLMFVLAVLSRHALGYGDVKLFGVIGLYLGLLPTYQVLLYGLIASAAAGIFLLLVRKKGKKYRMPFAPAVLAGYFVVLLFGMY